MPAVVVPELETASERGGHAATSPVSSRMVIVLGRGRRVVVDAAALTRVLDVLERR